MVNKPVYLLDSYAFLTYLNGEVGQIRVQQLLSLSEDKKCCVLMCQINLGEVLYITERERGLTKAQSVLALVESLPIGLLDVSYSLVLNAAHIKAHYTISYADAFAVAAAIRENAVVITGDPEFEAVKSIVKVEWLGK